MWTLWIGIECNEVRLGDGFDGVVLSAMREGIPLRTKTGLQLQAIKANGTIIGYGLVHKQLPKGVSVMLTHTQLHGLTESIREAFARYGISGPIQIMTGYTESPLLPVTE